MGRTSVASGAFTGETDGNTPSGFTQLNTFSGNVTIVSEQVHGTTGSIADIRPTTGTYSADQYASVKLKAIGSAGNNDQGGVCLRSTTGTHNGTDSREMYRVYLSTISPHTVVIERKNSGSAASSLATDTSQTWSANDTIDGEITGTGATVTIRALRNGVSIFTFDDTSGSRITAAGRPAICALQSGDVLRIDDWDFGDYTATSSVALSGSAGTSGTGTALPNLSIAL